MTDGLPSYSVCVPFNYFFAFFWLRSQDVQRCGSGLFGAACSIHGLDRGTGFPRISHISAYAAHQGELVLWYGLGGR